MKTDKKTASSRFIMTLAATIPAAMTASAQITSADQLLSKADTSITALVMPVARITCVAVALFTIIMAGVTQLKAQKENTQADTMWLKIFGGDIIFLLILELAKAMSL